MLECNDAAVHERHRFGGILHARWNRRVIKRIVERIAKNDEAPAMMGPDYSNPPEPKTATIGVSVPIRAIAIGINVGVAVIDPGLRRVPAHKAGSVCLRWTPRQPDR